MDQRYLTTKIIEKLKMYPIPDEKIINIWTGHSSIMTLLSNKYIFSYINYQTIPKFPKNRIVMIKLYQKPLTLHEYYEIVVIGYVKLSFITKQTPHTVLLYITNHCLRYDTGWGEIVLGRNLGPKQAFL